jgi:hypothetical protein
MKVLIILLGLALAPASHAQTFAWAAIEGNLIEPQGFSFVLGDQQCSVTGKGHGECYRGGVVTRRFRLPVEDGTIDRLAAARIDDDLALAYELTDGEGSWGKLVRLRTKKLKWQRDIGGLNMALPIARRGDVFVAALAWIARVNLRDGSFKWRLDRTYAGGGYESSTLAFAEKQLVVTWRDGTTNKVKVECLAAGTGRSERCASSN